MSAVTEQLAQLQVEYQRSRAFLKELERSIQERDENSADALVESRPEELTDEASCKKASGVKYRLSRWISSKLGSSRRVHAASAVRPDLQGTDGSQPPGTHAVCRPSIVNLDASALCAEVASPFISGSFTNGRSCSASFTALSARAITPAPPSAASNASSTNYQRLAVECFDPSQRTESALSPTTTRTPSMTALHRHPSRHTPAAAFCSETLPRLHPSVAVFGGAALVPSPAVRPLLRSGSLPRHAPSFRYRSTEAIRGFYERQAMAGASGEAGASLPGVAAPEPAASEPLPSLAVCSEAAWGAMRPVAAQTADGYHVRQGDGVAAAAATAVAATGLEEGGGSLPLPASPAQHRLVSRRASMPCCSPLGSEARDSMLSPTSSGAASPALTSPHAAVYWASQHASRARMLPIKGGGSLRNVDLEAAALTPSAAADDAVGMEGQTLAAGAGGSAGSGGGLAGPESNASRRLLPIASRRYQAMKWA